MALPVAQKAPKKFADDELVLNYHDAVLYGKDLALLESPTEWLNDSCIHYHFMRIQQQVDPTAGSTVLLDPAVASFLMHQVQDDDEVQDFCKGYNRFESTRRILVPINDNMAASSQDWQNPGAGTHWSLLLVTLAAAKKSIQFWHFDSVKGSRNQAAAHAVACKLYQVLQQTTKQLPIIISGVVVVQEVECPQQENGHDCGMHVLANAEIILADHHPNLAELSGDDENEYTAASSATWKQRVTERDSSFVKELRIRIANDVQERVASSVSQEC